MKEYDFYNDYIKKATHSSKYNFQLEPLIKNFSFLDFIKNGIKNKAVDYGAFLVITGKQYVVGYNSSFGLGSHLGAFARTFVDIFGGGNIARDIDAIRYSLRCEQSFITARIVLEYVNNALYKFFNAGYIFLIVPDDGISYSQYEVFEQFYEDYNSEIKLGSKYCGNNKFKVEFRYTDVDGTKLTSSTDSLDSFKEYLKTRINPNKTLNFDTSEIILGTEIKNPKQKK